MKFFTRYFFCFLILSCFHFQREEKSIVQEQSKEWQPDWVHDYLAQKEFLFWQNKDDYWNAVLIKDQIENIDLVAKQIDSWIATQIQKSVSQNIFSQVSFLTSQNFPGKVSQLESTLSQIFIKKSENVFQTKDIFIQKISHASQEIRPEFYRAFILVEISKKNLELAYKSTVQTLAKSPGKNLPKEFWDLLLAYQPLPNAKNLELAH